MTGIRSVFLISLFLIPSIVYGQPKAVEAAREFREQHAHSILQNYLELLRIPNVASDLPNIQRNADTIIAEFEKRGAEMELLTLPDQPEVPPVIYGKINTPGAERTLIIYVHYDGQPADPNNWTHAPWEPTLYSASMENGGEPIDFPDTDEPINPEWRIYGRSSSDDKAPFAAMLATLDAL